MRSSADLSLSSAAFALLLSTGVLAAAELPSEQQVRAIIQRVIAEEGGFENLCVVSRIDLDGNGSDEAVFTFIAGVHGSQVRAVSWKGGRDHILFENGSNTPNTAFVRVDGMPAIVLEQSDDAPNYVQGVRTQQLYLWDGRTFTQELKYDCQLPNKTTETGAIDSDDSYCRPQREHIPTSACFE